MWSPNARCEGWKLILSGISNNNSVQCTVVEEAIRKNHIISNQALGVDLTQTPEDLVLGLMDPLVRSTKHPVMVDVGANVGQLSVKALQEFTDLRSFLFEPMPSTCLELLGALIHAEVTDRSVLACTAATSSYANIHIDIANASTSNAVSMDLSAQTATGILGAPVASTVPTDLNVVLFKTDTQGFEWDVLKGSEALLMGGKAQALIVEVCYGLISKTKLSTVVELLEKIMSMGYTCTTMAWHGVLSRTPVQYGLVDPPPLSKSTFSPKDLEAALKSIGPTNWLGWTDLLCIPV